MLSNIKRHVEPVRPARGFKKPGIPFTWKVEAGGFRLNGRGGAPPTPFGLIWRGAGPILRRYWQLDYEPKSTCDETEAGERIRAALDEAVRIRLESEVPLGCLLSGGVDSSAVVAFMRRHVTGPLRTFSIGFEQASHNELPHARLVARRFETEHEEFIVRPDSLAVLPRLVWHCDEPFADSSALPTWYVAQLTRRRVTVALNGDGGDESFAGYTRYRGHPLIQAWNRLPRWSRQGFARPLAASLARAWPRSARIEQFGSVNRISLMPPDAQYAQYMLIFRDDQRRALCAGTALEADALRADPARHVRDPYNRTGLAHPVDRMLHADVMGYLPGDLLVKMDRMTMAHGLEGRSPFLDHQLMELAARLPAEMKLKSGETKHILKKALEPVLPAEILHLPKRGFSVPLKDWFRHEMQGFSRELLLSPEARARGLFNPAYIEKMLAEHAARRQNHHHRLWSLLCFETWCRTFLDRPDPSMGPLDWR